MQYCELCSHIICVVLGVSTTPPPLWNISLGATFPHFMAPLETQTHKHTPPYLMLLSSNLLGSSKQTG